MIMKLTATCMFDALKIEPYIVMYFFFIVFLENCGFFASRFSSHCGINFLQC